MLDNAANPGMAVLDVVYRVLRGYALGEFKVEIELGVGFTHKEEEAAGVGADLVHHLF